MKTQLFIPLFFLASLLCGAQTRTYTDNATSAFVIGLESYFYGNEGSLNVKRGDRTVLFQLSEGKVQADHLLLEEGKGATLIGSHEFTGDATQELVVGRLQADSLHVRVYGYDKGVWKCIGHMKAGGDGVREARVFRQAVTIRDHRTGVLYTWTWRGSRFAFKASDGSAVEP